MDILSDLNNLIQYVGIYSFLHSDKIHIYLPPGDELCAEISIEADYRLIISYNEKYFPGMDFITWLDADFPTYKQNKVNIVKEISNRLTKWYPNLKEPVIPDGKFTVVVAISGDVQPALKVAQYTYPDLEYNKAIETYVKELLQGKLDTDLHKKYNVKVMGSIYN